MSRCSHCGDEGHNIRTCPVSDVEKGPWFMDPDERWHVKVMDDGQEVSCNCDLFYEGEEHFDFDGM
jgi:hypothetical protein